MRSRILGTIALLLAGASVNAYAVAVAPTVYQPATPKAAAPVAMLTPAGTGGYVIALPAPAEVLKSRPKVLSRDPKMQARTGNKGRPLQIGFARAVPDGSAALALEKFQWVNTADGGRAARVVVSSPGASALRLGMTVAAIAPGVSVRFAGSGDVFGPVTATQMTASKRYWSPVLDGDKATLELYLPAGVALSSVQIALSEVSHLVVTGSGLKAEPIDEIGQSDSCERDVACVATPAALNQAKAVAKMVFTDEGDTFLCTGTLLNDSIHSNTAYFYTANHCMSSNEAADSLVTYWFFDAATCGSTAVPAYQTVTGGATFLGRSIDSDWALLRLRAPPPANAVFSAWRADVLANSTPISVIHHPSGDLKKFSSGTMPSYFTFTDDGSSYSTARYTQGSTEGGSSGSGLLTLGTGGGFYELRGGLFGGAASCSNTSAVDYYSRLDVALPLVAQYLTPDAANPQNRVVVVEYYAASLDDYFITADAAEIQGLDNGAHPGWARTGLTFLAYSNAATAPAGASPVCRFYVSPQYGDSHFYSADPAECAATATTFAGQWIEESPSLFYIQIPNKTTGACPANTRPVYRFLNNANQLHHRYTAEVDQRNCLYYGADADYAEPESCPVVSGQWTLEGYGNPPDQTVMCSPTN